MVKMLSLHYQELMGKIEEHERKKHLTIDDYMLDKALDKIKEVIGTEELDKLPDDITLKNVILMTCTIIKYDGRFYPQLFLEEVKQTW